MSQKDFDGVSPAAAHFPVARNALLNLLGQALPLLVGIVAIPAVVRGLGTEQFGILSLAWVILGYFTLFDFGLGRATTKLVAEEIARKAPGVSSGTAGLIWSSIDLHGAIGFVTGFLLWLARIYIVKDLFKIPPELTEVATDVLVILAVSLPVVMVAAALRGILEGAQRFAAVNAVKCVVGSLVFMAPWVSLQAGLGLRGIVIALLGTKLLALVAYLVLCFTYFPEMRCFPAVRGRSVVSLASYAGWVGVSNFISPFLVYLERFMVVSILTTGALTFYTAPYEMISRLAIIPASMATALFPAMTVCDARADAGTLRGLYLRSTKVLFIGLLPVLMVVAFFAYPILNLWLGGKFAVVCTHPLRILCVAFLANALAYVPFTLVYAAGRPDIVAKFYLTELPLFALASWFLVSRYGLEGAAYAKAFLSILDAVLLFGAATLVSKCDMRDILAAKLPSVVALGAVFFAPPVILALAGASFQARIVTIGISFVCYAALAWLFLLDKTERRILLLRRPK